MVLREQRKPPRLHESGEGAEQQQLLILTTKKEMIVAYMGGPRSLLQLYILVLILLIGGHPPQSLHGWLYHKVLICKRIFSGMGGRIAWGRVLAFRIHFMLPRIPGRRVGLKALAFSPASCTAKLMLGPRREK